MARTIRRQSTKNTRVHYPKKGARQVERRKVRAAERRELQGWR